MKTLYPETQPYQHFFLETNSPHSVYVELSGNPKGFPVVLLHGGPCSGTKPDHRRFFNPGFYRIILFDQRGCGKSLPFGELNQNTTQDLIDDMERIRQKLNIKKWLLFGGSWGATLALLYAQQYEQFVTGLILRGTFLARQQDMDWFAKDGASRIYPEQWQQLRSATNSQNPDELISDLHAVLWGNDQIAQRRAAKAWNSWGAQVALGNLYQPGEDEHINEQALKQARMELHYAKNRYFIGENQILNNCGNLRSIPGVIIHGRQDLTCPTEAALSLHTALPDAELIILSDAGHIAQGESMIDALVSATDKFINLPTNHDI